jgi:hypothetical protein
VSKNHPNRKDIQAIHVPLKGFIEISNPPFPLYNLFLSKTLDLKEGKW